MTNVIEIEPSQEQRQAFARWAVAQTPKLHTVGPNTFAVPADLFVQAPEEILIGARVDGRRYVSPDEDAAEGRPAPGELLGVATPEGFQERTAQPGDRLPEVAPAVYPSAAVPLGAVTEEEESDRSDSGAEVAEVDGPFRCDLCERDFPTERGRDSHRRRKHREA